MDLERERRGGAGGAGAASLAGTGAGSMGGAAGRVGDTADPRKRVKLRNADSFFWISNSNLSSEGAKDTFFLLYSDPTSSVSCWGSL